MLKATGVEEEEEEEEEEEDAEETRTRVLPVRGGCGLGFSSALPPPRSIGGPEQRGRRCAASSAFRGVPVRRDGD